MEQELILLVGVFFAGLVLGLILMVVYNKLATGSPGQLKQDMDDYQTQVESHFEETSKKFKDMTDQYQDLYQHLSVGATTLCRAENIAPGLADQSGPGTKALPADVSKDTAPKLDATEKVAAKPAEKAAEKSVVKEAAAEKPKPTKPDNKASKG